MKNNKSSYKTGIDPFQEVVQLSVTKEEDSRKYLVEYDYMYDKLIVDEEETGFKLLQIKDENAWNYTSTNINTNTNKLYKDKNMIQDEKTTDFIPWEQTNIKEYERHKNLLRYFDETEPIRKQLFKVKKNSIDTLPILIHKVNWRSLKKPSHQLFLRDFIPIPQEKRILTRCLHCLNTDHKSVDCNNLDKDTLCYICLSKEHLKPQCPFKTCLRCNKKGHSADRCKASKKTLICSSCWHVGHSKEDCLHKPIILDSKCLKKAYCYFCGKTGHFICDFEINIIHESDNSISLDASEESNQTEDGSDIKKLKKSNVVSQIELKVSCPKCAGDHAVKECSQKNKISLDDIKRRKHSKDFLYIGPSKLMHDKNFMNDLESD